MGKFLKKGAYSYLNRALTLRLVPLVIPHFSHIEKKNMDKVQNGRPQNVYLKSVWLK